MIILIKYKPLEFKSIMSQRSSLATLLKSFVFTNLQQGVVVWEMRGRWGEMRVNENKTAIASPDRRVYNIMAAYGFPILICFPNEHFY